MTLDPLVHALHGLRDAAEAKERLRCELRTRLHQAAPDDVKAHRNALRAYSDALGPVIRRREECHAEAVEWGRRALEKIERLEARLDDLPHYAKCDLCYRPISADSEIALCDTCERTCRAHGEQMAAAKRWPDPEHGEVVS